MKKMEALVKAAFLLTSLLFVCAVADFLALHDISQDYVSQSALQHLAAETSKELPAWTNTQMEWKLVAASYYSRVAVIILSLVILFGAQRELQKLKNEIRQTN
jgi:hypothetical protein